MSRQEIEKAYDVNDSGVITSPGKFEGEMVYVPYFWDIVLNGGADENLSDNGVNVDRIVIIGDDITEFDDVLSLDDVDCSIDLWEDDSGFVHAHINS